MSAELAKLAEVLGPYLRAEVDSARPRPDLHAQHDQRLTTLERDMARVIGLVEGVKSAMEDLVSIDKRVAEIEAARREDRARSEVRRETAAQRTNWVQWAIASIPGAAIAASSIMYQLGSQAAP